MTAGHSEDGGLRRIERLADKLVFAICVVNMIAVDGEAGAAEEDEVALFLVERTGVDAAAFVVRIVAEVARPEEEAIAIGKEDGPAMGKIRIDANALSNNFGAGAIGVNAPDGGACRGSKEDDVPGTP